MKIKIKKEVTEEAEIETPIYLKRNIGVGARLIRIDDPKNGLVLSLYYDGDFSFRNSISNEDLDFQETTPITEEEFNAAIPELMKRIEAALSTALIPQS